MPLDDGPGPICTHLSPACFGRGRTVKSRRPLGLASILCFVACHGCWAPRGPAPEPSARAYRAAAANIVVIKSKRSSLFDPPIAAFIAQVDANVTVFPSIPDRQEQSWASGVLSREPKLIFALGTPAAAFALKYLPEVPLLFGFVVDDERLGLAQRKNVMGVGFEATPLAQVAKFKMVLPRIRRLVVFYSEPHAKEEIMRASQSVATLGVELVAVPIESCADLRRTYTKSVQRADGVWMMADPKAMTAESFEFLKERTQAGRIALLTSVSSEFARHGALMSVSPDMMALGSQAASLARKFLVDGVSPSTVGVEPPMSSLLTVNLTVAHTIGLQIDEAILPLANEILECVSSTCRPDAGISPQ